MGGLVLEVLKNRGWGQKTLETVFDALEKSVAGLAGDPSTPSYQAASVQIQAPQHWAGLRTGTVRSAFLMPRLAANSCDNRSRAGSNGSGGLSTLEPPGCSQAAPPRGLYLQEGARLRGCP